MFGSVKKKSLHVLEVYTYNYFIFLERGEILIYKRQLLV